MSEVRARLLAQPFADGSDLRDFLSGISVDETVNRLRIVVAWAKRSGLQRAEPYLRRIGERGGSLELVVGISEGGATRQGLELARDIFDSVHVVHDRSGRTFHPKLYIADGAGRAVVMIGSNNLTAGGLYYNYEAGSILELDLDLMDDRQFFDEIDHLILQITRDHCICTDLTDDVLNELISNERYRIGDEDRNRAPQVSGAPEDLDAAIDIEGVDIGATAAVSIFGKSQVQKRSPVPLLSAIPGGSAQDTPAVLGAGTGTLPSHPVESTSDVVVKLRWYKKMSYSDAQQKRTPNTQVTGNLKLTEAQLPIDHKTFFRYVFFGDCEWAGREVSRGLKEEAIVPFSVTADGGSLGVYALKIDHAEFRVASQGNVATWLHWGSDLSQYLKDNNHVNDYVTLEHKADGTYGIMISENPTGDFIS